MRWCMAALLLVTLVPACSSPPRDEPADRSPSSGTGDSALPPPPEVPTDPSRGDRRVVLYQPNPSNLFILVNEGHSGRRTSEGQLRIALGNPHQAYKVVSEREMDALLESLSAQGFDRLATPFVPGDEKYLGPLVTSDQFRGTVLVETGGQLRKALGYRPGAGMSRDDYRIFTNLKGVVLVWWNAQSSSEQPLLGAVVPSRPR